MDGRKDGSTDGATDGSADGVTDGSNDEVVDGSADGFGVESDVGLTDDKGAVGVCDCSGDGEVVTSIVGVEDA